MVGIFWLVLSFSFFSFFQEKCYFHFQFSQGSINLHSFFLFSFMIANTFFFLLLLQGLWSLEPFHFTWVFTTCLPFFPNIWVLIFLVSFQKTLTVMLLIFEQKKCNYSKISQLPSHTFRLFHYVFIIPSRSSLQPQEEGLNPFHLLIIQIPWKARVIESSLTLMILDI